MLKQDPKAFQNFIPLISMAVTFILALVLILMVHNNWNYSMQKYVPLHEHINIVESEISKGHLRLEECITGNHQIDYDKEIKERFDEVSACNRSFIKILLAQTDTQFDKELLKDLSQIQHGIELFQKLSEKRYHNLKPSIAGNTADKEFDDIYFQLLETVSKTHKKIDRHFADEFTARNQQFIIFLTLFILLAGAVFTVLYRAMRAKIRSDLIIRKSEEELAQTQAIAHIGNWNWNLRTNAISWSDEVFRIFGEEPQSFDPTYEKFLSYLPEEDRENVSASVEKAIADPDNMYNVTHAIMRKDGTIRVAHEFGRTTLDAKGEPLYMLGSILDITERKEHEEKMKEKDLMLYQQAKMAAIGEMLENIAHQWRQPLTVIGLGAAKIIIDIELGKRNTESLKQEAQHISDHAQYLSNTIDDFRNYFNSDKSILHFNIKSMFEMTTKLLSSTFSSRRIETVYTVESIEMVGLENELIQAFMSILNNAKDVLETLEGQRRLLFVDIYRENEIAVIKIKDNGGGVPEAIITKIFEPYMTTKHKSQGTGLGLYIAEEIIVKHMHGTLGVKNIDFTYEGGSYRGAEFTITLPLEYSE